MARPINYEKEKIVESMEHLFWEKGYKSVSVEDVMQECDFNRNSFYRVFENKDGAYLAALEHHIESCQNEAMKLVSNKKGIFAIQAIFDFNLEKYKDSNGCFIINTLHLSLPENSKIMKRAKMQIEIFERIIKQYILQAQEMGDVSKEKDPEKLSKIIVTTLLGVRTSLKATQDKEKSKIVLDQLMDFITS